VARKPTPRKARPSRRVVGLRVRGRVYRAVLRPDLKVGGYTVRVLGLPGCITEGDTLEEARHMAKEAIELWLSAAGPGKSWSSRGLRHRIAAHIDT
jgi:predicted RNase H-like HicB family nuclease